MLDITSLGDPFHQYAREPRRDGTTEIIVYGYPITLDRFPGEYGEWGYRAAAWMDERDVKKTKPLVEERFSEHAFHETAYEYAKNANRQAMPQSTGVTECFLLEWAMKNMRTIEETAERRKGGGPLSFTDELLAQKAVPPIPTRTFIGEDGRTYHELDLVGEDTDPVLLEATRDRDRILALALEAEQREKDEAERMRQEGERLLREARARREREQAEFEKLPGFGSF